MTPLYKVPGSAVVKFSGFQRRLSQNKRCVVYVCAWEGGEFLAAFNTVVFFIGTLILEVLYVFFALDTPLGISTSLRPHAGMTSNPRGNCV